MYSIEGENIKKKKRYYKVAQQTNVTPSREENTTGATHLLPLIRFVFTFIFPFFCVLLAIFSSVSIRSSSFSTHVATHA